MTNILLTISYDGTDFCGWQRQDGPEGENCGRTVQGEIELALQKMLKAKIPLYGSGRTDSGVHAAGQAANFISPVDSVPEKNRQIIKDEVQNLDCPRKAQVYCMKVGMPMPDM